DQDGNLSLDRSIRPVGREGRPARWGNDLRRPGNARVGRIGGEMPPQSPGGLGNARGVNDPASQTVHPRCADRRPGGKALVLPGVPPASCPGGTYVRGCCCEASLKDVVTTSPVSRIDPGHLKTRSTDVSWQGPPSRQRPPGVEA